MGREERGEKWQGGEGRGVKRGSATQRDLMNLESTKRYRHKNGSGSGITFFVMRRGCAGGCDGECEILFWRHRIHLAGYGYVFSSPFFSLLCKGYLFSFLPFFLFCGAILLWCITIDMIFWSHLATFGMKHMEAIGYSSFWNLHLQRGFCCANFVAKQAHSSLFELLSRDVKNGSELRAVPWCIPMMFSFQVRSSH